MKTYRYMRIPIVDIPNEILQEYSIKYLIHNGRIYVEIRKGMYGLKEAGIIAYQRLTNKLASHGYYPVTHTPGLWKHKTLPATFTLAVDGFGIKYFNKSHADHLFNALQQTYNITIDWSGSNCCGLTIKWNYPANYVDISMPGYVAKAL